MSSIPQGHAFSSTAYPPVLRIHNPTDTPPEHELPTIRDIFRDIVEPKMINDR